MVYCSDKTFYGSTSLIESWHNLIDIPQEETPLSELIHTIYQKCSCSSNADFYDGTSISRQSFNSWINSKDEPKNGNAQKARMMCSRPPQKKLAEIANKDFIPSRYKKEFALIDNPSHALELIEEFVDSKFERSKKIREFYNGEIPAFTARKDVKQGPVWKFDRNLRAKLDKDLGLGEQAFSNAEWARILTGEALIGNIMAFQLVFYLQLSYEQSLQLLQAYGHKWQPGNPKSDFLLEQLNNGCFNAFAIVESWLQDARYKLVA